MDANHVAGAPPESISAPREESSGGTEVYALLLLGTLTFLAVFSWHAVNQRLPVWDSADFVLTSQKIARAFDEGFVAGARALYLERGWRPIIFPTLTAPFFLLSGGAIRLSVGLAQFTFTLLLVVYVYLFLRREYSVGRSSIASLLILGAPWLVNFSQLFFSELFWLAATAGLIFHFSAALQRSARSQYVLAGVWLGLMGATRPAETVVIALLPALTFLVYAMRHRNVKIADSVLFVLQLTLAASAVVVAALPDRYPYVIVALLIATTVVIALRARRWMRDSPFLLTLACGELIALSWHLPTIRSLYQWALATSFGSMAQLTSQQFKGVSPLTILRDELDLYSPELLVTIVILAVVGALNVSRPARNAAHSRMWALIGTAVLMMAPMLILYSWSGAVDYRRIMPAIFVLYLGVTALALSPHGLLPRVRLACGLGIATALLMTAAANGLNVTTNVSSKVQSIFGILRKPNVGQDPNGPVLDSLLDMGIKTGNIAAYSRCYRGYAECERNNLPSFEPMALSTLARERGVSVYVHYVTDLDFSMPDTLSKQISFRDIQYLLVDMAELQTPGNNADPYESHTEAFISMERSNLPPGLTRRGCFSTLNRPMCIVEVAR